MIAKFSIEYPLAWVLITEIITLIKVVLYIYYKMGESIVNELYTYLYTYVYIYVYEYAYEKTVLAKIRTIIKLQADHINKTYFKPKTWVGKYIMITKPAPPLIQEPIPKYNTELFLSTTSHEKMRYIQLYCNLLRQLILIRSLSMAAKRVKPGTTKHVVWKQGTYNLEDKMGHDSALTRLPIIYEEDRFYVDFEELASIMRNNHYLDHYMLDTMKSFHFCEYEYLVEEDDYFEQAYGDSYIAPGLSIVWISLILALLAEPLYAIFFWLVFWAYSIVLTHIYEYKLNRALFPYYNSSLIATSRDNLNVDNQKSLYYPIQDYVSGYTNENYSTDEISFLREDEDEPFYHEDEGGGGTLLTYIDDSGYDDGFDGDFDVLTPDDEYHDYDPFNVDSYVYPLYQWVTIHNPGRWDKFLYRHLSWFMEFDRWELEYVDELYAAAPETEHGFLVREGDIDGHLEYIEDAGDVDEGTGQDYLHDHPAVFERETCGPVESGLWTHVLLISYFEDGEEDDEFEWAMQNDSPPDEFSDDDETEEDEDEPREVEEEHHEECAEFDEVDYSCDEDLEDLAYTGTMAVGVEEAHLFWDFPDHLLLSSEKTILSSMSFFAKFLIKNKSLMVLDYNQQARLRNLRRSMIKRQITKRKWIFY